LVRVPGRRRGPGFGIDDERLTGGLGGRGKRRGEILSAVGVY